MKMTSQAFWIQVAFYLSGGLVLFSEEISEKTLPTVRVTARRFDESEQTIPASVTLISREQIEASGASSVPEVLQTEANMLVRGFSGNGASGQPSLRGFGDNSGLRVLVLVDGQKINPADMSGIDWQQIPLGRVKSIEVLRGGQTVLYGNHALSGVIKITTDKGGTPELRTKTAWGSDGFEQYNASYGGGAGLWFYSIGGDYTWNEGYRDNSLTHSKYGQATLGRFVGDNATLTIKGGYGESYAQYPGALSYDEMKDDPTQSSNDGEYYSRSTNGLLTVAWESEYDWGSVEINGGMTWRDYSWTRSGSASENKQRGYTFAPRVKFGTDSDFFASGLDLAYDTLDYKQYTDTSRDSVSSKADISRFTTGPYVFAQKETAKNLFLSGGIRYEVARTDYKNIDYVDNQLSETVDTIWGTLPNPNYKNPADIDPDFSYDDVITKDGWAAELALNWQPVDTFSMWVGVDRVYRYPALDETASYQGYTAIPDPLNEDLDPETGINFEIGAKWQSDHWKSSITLFHLTLDDEIAWSQVDVDAYQNTNIGKTRRIGCETELKYEQETYGASTMWTLVNTEFLDGENEDDNIPLVPHVNTTTSIWFQPIKRLRLRTTHTYVSSQYQGDDLSNDLRKIEAYHRFDAHADVTVFDHATLYITVRNLFDTTYAEYAYVDSFYPAAGRTFETGIKMTF